MKIFTEELTLKDASINEIKHINVSEKTKKLHKELYDCIKANDKRTIEKLEEFLISYYNDAYNIGYHDGDINKLPNYRSMLCSNNWSMMGF